jgi:hypothetical protein
MPAKEGGGRWQFSPYNSHVIGEGEDKDGQQGQIMGLIKVLQPPAGFSCTKG